MLHNIAAIDLELAHLNITQSTLCGLTGIPAGSLSDILRGVKAVKFEEEQAIYRALEGLDRLIKAAAPLQLDFKKTLQLKEQISLLDTGRLRIAIFIEEEQVKNDGPLFQIFLGQQYFKERRKALLDQYEIIGTPYGSQAVIMAESCVKEVAEALQKLGHQAQIIPCKIRNDDNTFSDFAQVWGTK
jgi:hypothetical protein